MFINNCGTAAGSPTPVGPSYQVPRSLRFRSSVSANITRTVTVAGDRTKFTWSGWVKRGALGVNQMLFGADDSTIYGVFYFYGATDSLKYYNPIDTSSTEDINYVSTAVFRDISAWYHVVLSVDTTQALATNRIVFYVNGVRQVTSIVVAASQNRQLNINRAITHSVTFARGGSYSDGYLADVYFVDGQALDPSYFGQTDSTFGAWTAKAYAPNVIAAISPFPTASPADPYWSSVKLLQNGASDLSGNTTITNFVSTVAGPLTGTTGLSFNVPTDGLIDYTGTGAFYCPANTACTIEMWIYISPGTQFPAGCNGGNYLGFNGGPMSVNWQGAGGTWQVLGIVYNTWQHVVLERDAAGQTWGAINGNLVASGAGVTGAVGTLTDPFAIGSFNTSDSRGLIGKISQLRLTVGVMRYAANFNPLGSNGWGTNGFYLPFNDTTNTTTLCADASGNGNNWTPSNISLTTTFTSGTSLLLHGDGTNGGTVFTDSSSFNQTPTLYSSPTTSTAQSKFGGASLSFANTALLYPAATQFNMGVGSFTVEAWVYFNTSAGSRAFLIGQSDSAGNNSSGAFAIQRTVAGTIEAYGFSGASVIGDITGTTVTAASTWYHIAYVRSGSTFTLYINGTSEGGTVSSSSSLNSSVNNLGVGKLGDFTSNVINAYMDDVRITKGIAVYTSNFSVPTAALASIAPTYAADPTYDSMYDVPLGAGGSVGNGLGNYPTWLSTLANRATATVAYADGNLFTSVPAHVGLLGAVVSSTSSAAAGKWYWECTYFRSGTYTGDASWVAVSDKVSGNVNISPTGITPNNSAIYYSDGNFYSNGTGTVSYGATYDNNDVIGVALDSVGNTIEFFKNGVSQGVRAVTSIVPAIPFVYTISTTSYSTGFRANFGQQPFTYTPPTGYKALHTGNLPDPTIKLPNQYFDAVTYTGALTAPLQSAQWPDASPADPSFSSVKTLLHFESGLTDSETTPKTFTATGGAAASATQKKFGTQSLSVLGANSYIQTPYSADFDFGMGDFTVEAWVYVPTSTTLTGNQVSLVMAGYQNTTLGGWNLHAFDVGFPQVRFEAINPTTVYDVVMNASGTFTRDAWHWVVAERLSGQTYFWFDGVCLGQSATLNGIGVSAQSQPLTIGAGGNGSGSMANWPLTGYIDEVRVTKGVARYTSQTITNPGAFQPDLVWVKDRSNARTHKLTDSVRGVTKAISTASGSGSAQTTDTGGVTAFNANGFTLGTDAIYNTLAETYVAWQWKLGTTPGFNTVTYTGNGGSQSVAHGLGVPPKFIFLKTYTNASEWPVYHTSLAAGNYLFMDATAASLVDATIFSATPDSTNFFIGSGQANDSGKGYVAYCFAPVANFSSFGVYTGNANTDGPFVYCGFKPRYVMMKRTDASSNWAVWDAARSTSNMVSQVLFANDSGVEIISAEIDFLANGFKLRTTGTTINASGAPIIYAVFAENPFKYALAR